MKTGRTKKLDVDNFFLAEWIVAQCYLWWPEAILQ